MNVSFGPAGTELPVSGAGVFADVISISSGQRRSSHGTTMFGERLTRARDVDRSH
ncbi:hypothetical protein [Mycolicibacterium sp.]|jgi:hypothetical protein|uniref:hypothetical protein n=1 Tax=Mycolicibacterium sp. TaxID=2320850 RepID=UPI0028AA01AF|nr:hypothetical protein [Mycolicibacterium sp.]